MITKTSMRHPSVLNAIQEAVMEAKMNGAATVRNKRGKAWMLVRHDEEVGSTFYDLDGNTCTRLVKEAVETASYRAVRSRKILSLKKG